MRIYFSGGTGIEGVDEKCFDKWKPKPYVMLSFFELKTSKSKATVRMIKAHLKRKKNDAHKPR